MRLRLLFALVLAAVAAVGGGALLVVPQLGLAPAAAAFWSLLVLALAAIGAWLVLERLVAAPLRRLRREARTLAETAEAPAIAVPASGPLQPLGGAVARLGAALTRARRETDSVVGEAMARGGREKSRLVAILRDLGEGVLVCSREEHRILLYNESAARALDAPPQLGLGRPLFELMTREPVLHALERLEARAEGEEADERGGGDRVVGFVGATPDGSTLLEGRMTLIREGDGPALGYVLSFADVGRRVEQLALRERLLRTAFEGLRGPLANLRAAAETLHEHPELAPVERQRFDAVVLQESAALADRLDALSEEHGRLGGSAWPSQRLHSADLLACVARAVGERDGITLTRIGLPLWLQGDSHLMLLVLQELLRRLAGEGGPAGYDVEALLSDRRVYLDLTWDGDPVPEGQLEGWLAAPLPGLIGGGSLGDALERLAGAVLWCRRPSPGRAALRLPIAAAVPPPEAESGHRPLPPRPEFYDFELQSRANRAARQDERPLREVDFVVFDTETTGLNPSQGDEVVSLAAVRIVNGRLLSGESFERLVDPRRPIPPESTRFHGITDAQVRGKPTLAEVMPAFKAFVGDAVLVGHNVAFDLKFLRLKEKQAGVGFDNALLDTLLLSRFLDPEAEDHSLDAVAARHGIEGARRHTALGDTLLTAAILVRQIEQLEARGIASLGEAVRRSDTVTEVKRLQAQF